MVQLLYHLLCMYWTKFAVLLETPEKEPAEVRIDPTEQAAEVTVDPNEEVIPGNLKMSGKGSLTRK